ncbi:MAG: hemolysin III family protein [Syntrophales bacterium LBB04]|nr:hemolysin III family protein [Syntrophales bacterium LBB04]
MSESSSPKVYKLREEIIHSVTHGMGLILAIAGLGILIARATACGGARHIAGCSIFGASLIVVYVTSTLYHGIQHPEIKKVLRIADHVSIYLLIAGTYTPFTLLNLRGAWGWSLFGIVWGLALLGIVLQFSSLRKYSSIRLILYITMGWAALVAIKPLAASVTVNVITLIVAGGVTYTFGIIFYLWRRLPYHHVIWHLFVLSGSALHYFAVLLSLNPLTV